MKPICRFNIFIFLVCTAISPIVRAQIVDTSNRVQVSLAIENPSYGLRIDPRAGNGTPIQYRPNTRSLSGIEFAYKFLAFGYLTKAPLTPTDEARYGKTEYDDYRSILSLGAQKQWFIVAYYNRYKGFYVENTKDLNLTTPLATEYLQRPDLAVSNAGIGAVYVLSPKSFSPSAAIFQTARQTSSGGSFLIMSSADTSTFSGDTAMVPDEAQRYYGRDAAMTKGEFNTLSLSGGAGYTLVVNRSFFLTGIGLIGLGYQWRKYGNSSTDTSETSGSEKQSFMISAGQNADNYYIGGGYIQDITVYRTESIVFNSAISTIRFFVGVRI